MCRELYPRALFEQSNGVFLTSRSAEADNPVHALAPDRSAAHNRAMRLTGQCPLCLGPTRHQPLCCHCRRHIRAHWQPPDTLDTSIPLGVQVFSLGPFAGALRRVVLAVKHGRDQRLNDWCGQQLAIQSRHLVRPDALTYVPSQRLSRLRRGGDTAAGLAAAIGRERGIAVVPTLQPPWRIQSRTRQHHQRQAPKGFRYQPQPVGRLWLVDDLMASGHSLHQAHDQLSAEGHIIEAWLVIARA